jgi:hypothetical protein
LHVQHILAGCEMAIKRQRGTMRAGFHHRRRAILILRLGKAQPSARTGAAPVAKISQFNEKVGMAGVSPSRPAYCARGLQRLN